MGKVGRKSTPKAILELRGSKMAKGRPDEPEPVSGLPVKPAWLGEIASKKWDEIAPELAKLGVMAVAYADFLAMYCQAHQDLHDAIALIAKEGMTCMSEKGGAYLHPAVAIKHNAIDRIAKFGREFGISPSSIRDVVKTPTKDKASGVAARKR